MQARRAAVPRGLEVGRGVGEDASTGVTLVRAMRAQELRVQADNVRKRREKGLSLLQTSSGGHQGSGGRSVKTLRLG